MKKQINRNDKNTVEGQEELETIHEITKIENGQPVPRPKDYDEIEY